MTASAGTAAAGTATTRSGTAAATAAAAGTARGAAAAAAAAAPAAALACSPVLFQQPPLLCRQAARHLDHHSHILVAPPPRPIRRIHAHAVPAHAQLVAGLRAGLDGHLGSAINGRHTAAGVVYVQIFFFYCSGSTDGRSQHGFTWEQHTSCARVARA